MKISLMLLMALIPALIIWSVIICKSQYKNVGLGQYKGL